MSPYRRYTRAALVCGQTGSVRERTRSGGLFFGIFISGNGEAWVKKKGLSILQKRISLSTPTMHGDEMKYIQEAFERNWIAPLGFNVDNFETEMNTYFMTLFSMKFKSRQN